MPAIPRFSIHCDKHVGPGEFADLMRAVGWGEGYAPDTVARSLAAYPFIAHARSAAGQLLGYVSAFSDRAFSTMLGELVVDPGHARRGIGRALLATVEAEFPGVPVYVKPLGEAHHFFRACGYKPPCTPMQVLFKRNATPA